MNKKQNNYFLIVFIITIPLLLLGFIIFIFETSEKPGKEITKYTQTERIACRDFIRLYDDINNGIVNDNEVRERVKDIYERGKYSNNLEGPLRELLSGITNQDEDLMILGYQKTIKTCNELLR